MRTQLKHDILEKIHILAINTETRSVLSGRGTVCGKKNHND